MRFVKILFLAANPSDTARLKTDEERRKIEVEILKSPHRDRIQLIYEPAVRPVTLIEVLRRHRPQIIHFSGHGSKSNQIILESDDGTSELVGTEILEDLFRLQGRSVRVVMLNACYSEVQARVLTRHVDCAIGMNRAIPDPMAIEYATAFYQGLAYGESVRAAFEASLLQLRLSSLPGLRGQSRDLDVGTGPAAEVEGRGFIPELLERSGSDASRLVLVEENPTASLEGIEGSDSRRERGLSDSPRTVPVGMTLGPGVVPFLIGGSVLLVVIVLLFLLQGLGTSHDGGGKQDDVTNSEADQRGRQSPTPSVVPLDEGLRRLSSLPAADVLRIAYKGTPPGPTAHLGLEVNILVRRARQGEPVPLQDGEELASGEDDYRLVVTPQAPGYLYLF